MADDRSARDEPVSVRVVRAVAEAEGVPPEDLTPVLNDAVNVDALDSMYRRSTPPVRVEFRFAGYHVEIDAAGNVTVG